VTLMVAHDLSRLRILTIFPSIFKGGHVKHKKNIHFFKGHEVTVRFDRPTALQIDGETVLDVLEYTVLSAEARRRNRETKKETVNV
jgi:diacylglycerol kinase family enzyme